MVQRLEGHAGGGGPVADHGHDLARAPGAGRSLGHAEGRRDRRARVACAEGVVGALGPPQEARRTVGLLHPPERLAPAGQDLVPVRLVSDVPDQPVVRRVEHGVEGDGELDRTEAPGEVAADGGADPDQVRAQLAGHALELFPGRVAERARVVDRGEQRRSPLRAPAIAGAAPFAGGSLPVRGSGQRESLTDRVDRSVERAAAPARRLPAAQRARRARAARP